MLGVETGTTGDAKRREKVSLLERNSKKQTAMHMGWGARYPVDRETTHLRLTWPHLFLKIMLR